MNEILAYIKRLVLKVGLIPEGESKSAVNAKGITTEEVEKLVSNAYFHCFPIVENYKAIYAYSILKTSPKYVPFNTMNTNARLYLPKDKFVVSPNNDTFYSTANLDLRSEPVIIKVPAVKDRYYCFQLISLVTDNFAYIGTNSTGTDAGIFAITSPFYKGKLPSGVKEIKSPSEIVGVIGRTEVNADDPEDIKKAQQIQEMYQIAPMHTLYPDFQPAPTTPLDFPTYQESDKENERFFHLLNFLLQLTTLSKDEAGIIEGFKVIGVESGKPYTFFDEHPDLQSAILKGISKGIKEINLSSRNLGKVFNGWTMYPLVNYFGNNYQARTNIAKIAIYANDPEEAYYPMAFVDSENQELKGSSNYQVTFSAEALPPVKYFWSLTMYDNQTQLLVENEINRYSIGDRTKSLIKNGDGSVTIYIGHKIPRQGKENWLPAPEGKFNVMMRLYGPHESVLNGRWTPPPIVKVK